MLVRLPREVRDQLRAMFTSVATHSSSVAEAPTSAFVTDASTSGMGVMYSDQHGKATELSLPVHPSTEAHIDVLELTAVREAVKRVQGGRSYYAVVDNTVAYHTLRSGLGAPRLLPILKEVHDLCAERGVTVFPLWLSTANMAAYGADAASRLGFYRKCPTKGWKLKKCLELAREDTRRLQQGRAPYLKARATPSVRVVQTCKAKWKQTVRTVRTAKYGADVAPKPLTEKQGKGS